MSFFYIHTLSTSYFPSLLFCLRFSFKWVHAASDLLKFISFTQDNVFEIHLSCCMFNSWFLFIAGSNYLVYWNYTLYLIFHCMEVPQFIC